MKKLKERIKAWSYSRYELYTGCPAKANYSINERIKEPSSPALDKGARIHDLAKEYVRGIRKQLPEEFLKFEDKFKALRKADAMAEVEWAFTKEWKPTSWYGKEDTWVRIKVDAIYTRAGTVTVIDYKTGKDKTAEVHENQRSLYALGALLTYPKAKAVNVEHWYLEHGTVRKSSYERDDLEKLKQLWAEKTKPMLNDTIFAPNPTNLCNWCWFRRGNSDYGRKGGPCPY